MKTLTICALFLTIGMVGCTSNENSTFTDENGQECRRTYNQIYQPPVTVGGAGTTISVPGDTVCTDPEDASIPEDAIVPTQDEASRTVQSINQAQRQTLSFFESANGPNLTCKITDRGEDRVESIECQKTSGSDLCLRGMFENGVAENLERCFDLPAQVTLFDSTRYDLGAEESHLLESWAVWGAEENDPVVYNTMFASFSGAEWQPMFAGFGQPSKKIAQFMAPEWLNRPESRGRVVPPKKPVLVTE